MKAYVHFTLVYEIENATDSDDAFDQALDRLRNYGDGEMIKHAVIDEHGNALESN